MEKIFDLNTEQVLEHWGLEHALREIIANAIDEQTLTETSEIQIYEDANKWHIRDYGRGLEYIHFTQNENKEKLQHPNLIGKFGVGLKDALSVFERNNVSVEIHSKFAVVTLKMAKKSGFDIETLHAVFSDALDSDMIGTEFIISGVAFDDIEKAKNMFLQFSKSRFLERTKYGEVYSTNEGCAYVYINGAQVAKEDNFMFSYNITNVTAKIKKSLNRERTNVGRAAYSDSIKKILTRCKEKTILSELVKGLKNIMSGENKDEFSWKDVVTYAAQTLDKEKDVAFLTLDERAELTSKEVEILEQSGKEVVVIQDSVKTKLGNSVTDFSSIMVDYVNSFEYKIISYSELSDKEKSVFNTKHIVLEFLKKHRYKHEIPIVISETIRVDRYGETTDGIFCDNRIIIRRQVLQKNNFLGVLLHEFAHFISGESDNTRAFESQLTEMLNFTMSDRLSTHKNERKG